MNRKIYDLFLNCGVLNDFPYPIDDFDKLNQYDMLLECISRIKKLCVNDKTLTNRVDALYNYVTNYFDNLDVQEEINNKLDEMAEDGTLASIIAQFLSVNSLLYFDSVSTMKQSENLIAGQYVTTKGFYRIGDGGQANYIIRERQENEVSDEIITFNLLDDTLLAELIIKDRINILQLGCKGDGETEHQELKIQAGIEYMFNKYNKVHLYIPNGTYIINWQWYVRNGENYGLCGIRIHSNTTIEGESLNAILQAQSESYGQGALYGLIRSDMDDNAVSNIIIKNLSIDGSSATHNPNNNSESNIILESNKNILIDNVKSINCKGNGIYINGRSSQVAENISVNNCFVDNCKVIGIEVGRFKKGTITNNKVSNCENNGIDIYGMLQSGGDPLTTDWIISNNVVDTTLVGIFPETTMNGQVTNNVLLNNSEGVHINSGYNTSKNIDISNNFMLNNGIGVNVTGATYGVDIHDNDIKNCTVRPFILDNTSEVNIHNNKLRVSNTNALIQFKGATSSFNRFTKNILEYSSSSPSKIAEFGESTVVTRVIYDIIDPNSEIYRTVNNSNNQFCEIPLPTQYDTANIKIHILINSDKQYTTYDLVRYSNGTYTRGNKNTIFYDSSDVITNQSIYNNQNFLIWTTQPNLKYKLEITPII